MSQSVFETTGADSSRYFAAVLGLTISTTTISYLFIFPALVKLRYSRPDMEHRRCRRSLLPPGRQDAPGDGRRAGRAGLCPG
jgi:amino acid transporter